VANRRRSRHIGAGMIPLFNVEAFTRTEDETADAARSASRTITGDDTSAPSPTPVDYWVRGVFRHGEAQMTRTVRAVGMSTRLDADRERFIDHLKTEGWLFPDGRATLIELLGVGADDGREIMLNR